MTSQRPGNRAGNYKSPARGITVRSRPAWIETGRGKDGEARNKWPATADPLAHLWFMRRKTAPSGGGIPLEQPQTGFFHRSPFGISPRQTAIELPDAGAFFKVLAGILIEGGSP